MSRGTINGEPYEMPDGYSAVQTAYHHRLLSFANVLSDLTRSEHGRHLDDAESQTPGGTSLGNPILPVGSHIGYTMDGDHIVIPVRAWWSDPQSWVVPRPPKAAPQPERLYGLPGAENLHSDVASCYESDIDEWREDGATGPFTIEEWTTSDARSCFPAAGDIAERLVEMYTEDFADEDCYEAYETAAQRPDVVALFEAALVALCSHVTYRMADQKVAEHTVTFDDNGEPLLDGQPMYVKNQIQSIAEFANEIERVATESMAKPSPCRGGCDAGIVHGTEDRPCSYCQGTGIEAGLPSARSGQ